jgi:hypothetical protein
MRDILPVSFKTYLDVFKINELLRYSTNKYRKISPRSCTCDLNIHARMSKSFIILCTPTLWDKEVEIALVSRKTLNALPGQGWRTSQGAEIDECAALVE